RNIQMVGMPECLLMRDHPVRSIKGGFAASFLVSRPPLLFEEGSWATLKVATYLLLPLLLIATNAFGANDCDRACLKTSLDQYLNAVVKHDPSAAPLFAGFRQTENAVVVRTTTGLWKSLTGLGKVQRRYFDPVSGQAAYYGIIEEGAASDIATVRIKV